MDNTLQISVVICTYNRDQFINKCLECLAQQTLSKKCYEVILVDNNSTDSTASIAQSFIASHPQLNIRYVFETNKGLSFARNRGIAEAHNNIITYIDDDAEATPVFLETILNFLKQHHDVVGVGGKVIPLYSESKEPKWMNKYLNGFVAKVDLGNKILLYDKKMKYPAGCNMTYRKEILQKAGGFNNKLTFRSDDKYIFFEVKKISSTIYYLPDATVYHNIDADRLTFENFKKLFLKTGNEEKVRILSEGSSFDLLKKFFELVLKLLATTVLYFKFLLKEEEIKGRYVFLAHWFTLVGFVKKKIFVR